jgi:hypothetical protein
MSKLALLIGIDFYESIDEFPPLECCVNDAEEMAAMLKHNWSPVEGRTGPIAYDSQVFTSNGKTRITADFLASQVDRLMNHPMGDGEVLFYFSGHGVVNENGGFLVTQEGTLDTPGYPMAELLETANRSRNSSVVIILDCCNSGEIGNITDGEGLNRVSIGPNVTILAASGATQESAEERGGHSLFTRLLLDALDGGAADLRGEVSAAALYAYVEQALGPWDQRPVYKSYARKLDPIRKCKPAVPDDVLARLTEWFPAPDSVYRMDKSYEEEEKDHCIAENVAIFKDFKKLRNARLLDGEEGRDLYWMAMEGKTVHLTPQGKLYWKRARRGDF